MLFRLLVTILAVCGLAAAASAETRTLRLGVQRGLTYLPFIVMKHERFVEKQIEKAGMPPIEVEYLNFSGGQAMTDGLLSEQIDIAATGIPSFLALWAKGKGKLAIKGVASYGTLPIAVVTRNPNVRTLADFTDADRIATPGAKTSLQAIFLAMAAEKLWGIEKADRFDSISVTRGHPDAMAALLGNTEINSHFAIPPYLQLELKRPDIHIVATSEEIVGGTVSNGTIFLLMKFHEANPKTVAAYYEALKESVALINADTKRAAADYLAVSGEKSSVEDIEALIRIPGTVYDVAPHGTMKVAQFLNRRGMIATAPKDWKELYLPMVHNEPGS